MQIDTLWPFYTICRSIHYYHFVPYADRHIMTISYHMQIDTFWLFRTICRSIEYDHFVYAKSYADRTFSLILHHIQINVMPKYMLHVGTVKSMNEWMNYYYIYSLFIILFNKDNYFVTPCRYPGCMPDMLMSLIKSSKLCKTRQD